MGNVFVGIYLILAGAVVGFMIGFIVGCVKQEEEEENKNVR